MAVVTPKKETETPSHRQRHGPSDHRISSRSNNNNNKRQKDKCVASITRRPYALFGIVACVCMVALMVLNVSVLNLKMVPHPQNMTLTVSSFLRQPPQKKSRSFHSNRSWDATTNSSSSDFLLPLVPRAFAAWNETERGGPVPCYPWVPPKERLEPVRQGLLFLKPLKVGGSTAAGYVAMLNRKTAHKGANTRACLHRNRCV